jgi:hypothetical protein
MTSRFPPSETSTPLDPTAPPLPRARCRLVYAVYFDKFRHIDFATRDDALAYLAAHNPRTSRSAPGVLLRIQTLDPPPEHPTVGTAPEWVPAAPRSRRCNPSGGASPCRSPAP